MLRLVDHALLEECLVGVQPEDAASPIIGYAMDGFPIYGPRGCLDAACSEVVTFKSGWQQTGDPSTYAWDNHAYVGGDAPELLDACNGRVGPDGTYRYHVTETFPYIIGCYAGTPLAGATGTGAPEGDPAQGTGGPGGAPASCTSDADCGAACPADAMGCTCDDGPMGQICVPACEDTSDCPTGLTCMPNGICVPGR